MSISIDFIKTDFIFGFLFNDIFFVSVDISTGLSKSTKVLVVVSFDVSFGDSSEDELLMERFHESPWNERSKLIEGFEDARYRQLAERLICTNDIESADESTKVKFKEFVKQRTHESGPWLSLDKALEKTQNLLVEAEGERKEILETLELRLNSLK